MEMTNVPFQEKSKHVWALNEGRKTNLSISDTSWTSCLASFYQMELLPNYYTTEMIYTLS